MLSAAFINASAQETTTTGWMLYNDTMGRSLELTPEQNERLQEWNARYQQEFDRLGDDGMQHRDHTDLQERRNLELQGILTQEQYDRWNEMDNNRNWRSTNTTGGGPGPEMRRNIPADQEPDILDERDRDRSSGIQQTTPATGTNTDRSLGTDGGTGTTGTGSATDGGNRNTVTPPTP